MSTAICRRRRSINTNAAHTQTAVRKTQSSPQKVAAKTTVQGSLQKTAAQRRKARRRARRRKAMMRFLLMFTAVLVILLAVVSFFKGIQSGEISIPLPKPEALPALTGEKRLTGKDFGIETVTSGMDYNGNGVDDYTDILNGAKKDAQNHPEYDGTYQDNAYPPDNIGVCSDVVWRALKNAGYCLREMVDNDISRRPWDYPEVESPDWNIDFRRVKNLRVFFDKYAQVLTTDINDIEQWQPGDIVIFGENRHIGVVSDRRNTEGRAYMLHNGGQPEREEDYLGSKEEAEVAAHYRFDATKIPEDVLVPWHD